MTILRPIRLRLTFGIRSWFLFTLLVAVGLATWRAYETPAAIANLRLARDSALSDWRRVKRTYDAGKGTAADEAEAREKYFKSRAAVEQAIETSS